MFHKILVALDYSDDSPVVFAQAVELAKKNQASLMLLHVLSSHENTELDTPFSPSIEAYGLEFSEILWSDYARRWRRYEKEGLDKLRAYQRRAKEAGVEAEFSQNAGSPGACICQLAYTWGADLIVMGSRRRSGLVELLLGSNSNYVTHHTRCSVWIVHSPQAAQALGAASTVLDQTLDTDAIPQSPDPLGSAAETRSPEADAWEVVSSTH